MSTHASAEQHRDNYEAGIKTFGALFTRFMDTNQFSHPQMVSLTRACMDGVSWLHSSQISGLRHCKLLGPGPRTFIAIYWLNWYLHRYITQKQLLPNTSSSNAYAHAWAVTEDGEPPSVGWWMEVFAGLRTPKDIDLTSEYFSEDQAERKSAEFAALTRKLMMAGGVDIVLDLDHFVRECYPAGDHKRVSQLKAVLMGQAYWSADELANELPALTALVSRLRGPKNEDELLQALSDR